MVCIDSIPQIYEEASKQSDQGKLPLEISVDALTNLGDVAEGFIYL